MSRSATKKSPTTISVPQNKIFCADCISGMESLPDACIDLVITDPPFAIDFKAQRANYNRRDGRVLSGYQEVAAAQYLDFTRAWMRQVFRTLKPSGSVFIFSGWNHLHDILKAATETGFITVNHIIWKYQFGVYCRRRFVTSHYHCLFYCKDDKRRKFFPNQRFAKTDKTEDGGSAQYRDLEDVWTIPREYWQGDKKTPTKLPAAVIEKILAYASAPKDLVLDPFLGSGQVAVVSKMNQRHYLGYEIVEAYVQFARERLETGVYRIKDKGKPQTSAKNKMKC